MKKNSFISRCATYKNTYFIDKPNEDVIINDDSRGIYILLDGVSVDRVKGKYPDPSPALIASRLFSENVYKYLINSGNKTDCNLLIEGAIKFANKKLALLNMQYKFPFNAGTVGIIAIINNNYLYYSYIGDCFGRIVSDTGTKVFTEEQTYLVKIHKKELKTNEIRFSICNNMHHPYGYGVFDGSQGALDFVRSGKLHIKENDIIILSSDGYEEYLKDILYPVPEDILTRAQYTIDKVDDRSILIIKREK